MNLINKWQEVLKPYIDADAFDELGKAVNAEYRAHKCFPPADLVFNALNLVPPDTVRAVILGQDPYFNEGQAMGLAFSVNPESVKKGVAFPPSLENIIKEIKDEFGACQVQNGDLTVWAKQGVLLLNTCLSVRAGIPLSHQSLWWEHFIKPVMNYLNTVNGIIFVLWGGNAKKYGEILNNPNNLVLSSAHPSPLSASRGFFGCGHFQKINDWLTAAGRSPINW